VNWVLDADIRGFFDAIDHEWLMRFVEHRIADQRVLRHIKKWLNAGVLEDGKKSWAESGTPQGGSISPLLANVYLHYALDLWAEAWRQRHAHGDVIIVRYVDDFVLGFQHRDDAERFLAALKARLEGFHLELHPDKTRLIEFGRFAAENRQRRGEGKPATFDFLGFTHYCGKTRAGRYQVGRKTRRKSMVAKLAGLKRELRRRMHAAVPATGAWLTQALAGHYRYYGVPGNSAAMTFFRDQATYLWRQSLRRRSQKARLTWQRMHRLARRWLPLPRIRHPYPAQRLGVITQGRSPVR
jgi:group II intron reverse transcriptase/maturase